MPELPDVETWKRYVDATALHQKIAEVEVDAPRMLTVSARKLKGAIEGARFESAGRHGKNLFVALDGGGFLLLHFGMTGYLEYGGKPEDVPEKARLVIRFAEGSWLAGFWQRRLGRIGLVDSIEDFVEAERLGPDALDVDIDAFREMLRDRRGSLKSALMDQGFIAGIGNVYSDEILYQAGLHPKASARELDDRQTGELHRAMRHVLKTAADRKADPGRMPDSWLLPRREDGAPCPRCEGEVEPIKISGRTAYHCPACQGGS